MISNTSTNSQHIIYQPINDDYEWIQYNSQLKLIHSKHDDMYHMQSIIDACNSNKIARHWFNNKSTHELIDSVTCGRICTDQELYQLRDNLPNQLKGYYVHRLLVNHIAMWASPKYAWYIMKLLDSAFEYERKALTRTIAVQEQTITEQDQTITNQEDQDKKLISNLITKNSIIIPYDSLMNIIKCCVEGKDVLIYDNEDVKCCASKVNPIRQVDAIKVISDKGEVVVDFKQVYNKEYNELVDRYHLNLKHVVVN